LGLSVPDLGAEGEKLRRASVGGPSQRFSQLAELQAFDLPPTNAEIAELLSREASEASYVLQRAYSRAREAPSSGSRSLIPRCRNTRAHHSFASSATS